MLLAILVVKKLLGRFTKKKSKRTNQKEFKIEKIIRRTGVKLYVKRKRDNNSFDSWIDKKDMV